MLEDMVRQAQRPEIVVEPFLQRDVGVADRAVQSIGNLRGQSGHVL
ncbi:hypothetical protein [Streptomyces sp. NPDC002520]